MGANGKNSRPSTFGARIRHRRWRQLRVFQSVVAAAVGISAAQLCEIERGTAGTTEGTLAKLAAVLGLDYEKLRAQAKREGRLDRSHNLLEADTDPALASDGKADPLPRLAPRRRRRASKDWLTANEAAALLGCSPGVVRYLIRRGKLAPAHMQPKSRAGQRKWLVAASAVEQYDPPNFGRTWNRPRRPAPDGYLSLDDFAARVGVPKSTLYRRIAHWDLVTVKDGTHRWVPEDQIAVYHQRQSEEAGVR